jgi:hypothetical protein
MIASSAQTIRGASYCCDSKKKPTPKTSEGIARYRLPENARRE